MRFADPWFLFFLLLVPVVVYWYFSKRPKLGGTIKFPSIDGIKKVGFTRYRHFFHIPFLFRTGVIILLILSLSRPQSRSKQEELLTEGIDIVICIDISSSMLAEDFKPRNRLEAAKLVAADFIKGRKNDRIGMVVFAGRSYTQCPLTLDYGILIKFLEEIKIGMVEDGTAIGMAIANCVNRLRNSKAKSKVVILLTDGRNNRGEIDPLTAAQIAKAMNVRIYTIGAGKKGVALYPVNDPIFGKRYVRMPVEIDEDVLIKIAKETGGKYFRATDEKKLESIFKEIGEMEKTKIKVKEYTRYSELFSYFLAPAMILLLLEII
ncbi:aerotolerance regulator BatA, partial [candidate division KSB1 bacterium]